MQRLMPDSGSLETERRVQPVFRFGSIFSGLALLVLILGFDRWLGTLPNRADGPPRIVPVDYRPAALDPRGFLPLRLVGAWEVSVGDPRFGGISGLAADEGELLALTDSGTLAWLPKPGSGGTARVRDLPAGPGLTTFKHGRDSEALAPDGRGGWWIAFEHHHQVWHYERGLQPVGAIELPAAGGAANLGVEAMLPTGGGLLLLGEGGETLLAAGAGPGVRELSLRNPLGSLSDAALLPDGRRLLLVRNPTLLGFDNRLAELVAAGRGYAVRPLGRLRLGALANAEALAAERIAAGTIRLWVMTDNAFSRRRATLLVALDLPELRPAPARAPSSKSRASASAPSR